MQQCINIETFTPFGHLLVKGFKFKLVNVLARTAIELHFEGHFGPCEGEDQFSVTEALQEWENDMHNGICRHRVMYMRGDGKEMILNGVYITQFKALDNTIAFVLILDSEFRIENLEKI